MRLQVLTWEKKGIMQEIVSEEIVFDGKLTIEKAELKKGDTTFERYRLLRQDASAVLLVNPDARKVILTRQFHYPVLASTEKDILEIVAGKLDEGESPKDAALREMEEETGYRVEKKRLTFLTSCFSSPGYSTEQFHIFLAFVTEVDKISEGGGMEEENERIGLVEIELEEFQRSIRNGTICDAKTIIAGLLMEEPKETPGIH